MGTVVGLMALCSFPLLSFIFGVHELNLAHLEGQRPFPPDSPRYTLEALRTLQYENRLGGIGGEKRYKMTTILRERKKERKIKRYQTRRRK